jgi:hypothetical protein
MRTWLSVGPFNAAYLALLGIVRAQAECFPRRHHAAAPFEQVAAAVRLLYFVADHMRQGHFNNLARWVQRANGARAPLPIACPAAWATKRRVSMRIMRGEPGSKYYFDRESRGFYPAAPNHHGCINTSFSYGAGREKRSQIQLQLTWEDIELAVRKFAELGNPEAIKLEKMRKLAAAIHDYLASGTPPPQSN